MDLQDADLTDDAWSLSRLGVLIAVFATLATLAAMDLIGDSTEGTSLRHVYVEGFMLLTASAGLAFSVHSALKLVGNTRRLTHEAKHLNSQLVAKEAEATRWRTQARDLLRGLGEVIDEQLEAWGLSPAEKEVALLLLKGLSMREVAAARDITEATARQQARAVYKKAGLHSRNDLAAFFLEDLLLPARQEAPTP